MNRIVGRVVSILLLPAMAAAAQAQTKWQLPVTIQVTQDVSVEPLPHHLPFERPRATIYIGQTEKGFTIKKGEMFKMTTILPEGNCTFRFKNKTYQTSYCYWLDGFTDHDSDVFVVIRGRIPPR